ncbi:MAG: acetyl-CoA carboxylase biotin carboxyl carrier protein [Pyrinomonadaceae bacterium]|nr:acetyl-CoA carboxylase biotin carboxyl carrier protein [Pyrinomonadaceae bacterium]
MSDNTASAKAKKQEETGESKARRSSAKKTVQTTETSFNMAELRELAELVNEHGFTDFEFENENIRVRLSKMTSAPIMPPVQSISAPTAAALHTSGETKTTTVSETPPEEELHQITSPIVGTFYRSASPDKDPYIKEGSKVSPETTVCIVEAMKLMNEIQAETSGEVVKIYVENGQPVEYGQPLFGIRK